jgi:hypothetical protein
MPRWDMIRVRTYEPSTESIHLFASAPPGPCARRPVDGLRAVAYALLFLSAAVLSQIGDDLEQSLSDALTSFPGFLKVLWLCGFWLAIVWSASLLVIAAFRQRVPLALSGLVAAALAIAISLVAGAIVSDQAGDVITRFADPDQPPLFPLAALAITSAVRGGVLRHRHLEGRHGTPRARAWVSGLPRTSGTRPRGGATRRWPDRSSWARARSRT